VAGTLTGIEIEVQRVVNGLVSLELDERVAAFDAAVDALNGQIQRWSEYGARLRAGDVVPGSDGRTRSDINIEVVFDPPRHARLPISDDEIVDRALAIQALADRKVTLLTYDTGQATRARSAGLQVVKLRKPIGEPRRIRP